MWFKRERVKNTGERCAHLRSESEHADAAAAEIDEHAGKGWPDFRQQRFVLQQRVQCRRIITRRQRIALAEKRCFVDAFREHHGLGVEQSQIDTSGNASPVVSSR